ncbi:glycosyltransferase [Cytophaga sp. FL35]|uniref:glycosyltransferase n=1 Tax=Cytophaga sp. FL35 TaxID=1904456 RepID=UPI0016538214|nr:glycosyltransferase [Cytophaga sp. FL35]MBC6999396.1 glycosyltransferase [Cytophaga sp. FL35]
MDKKNYYTIKSPSRRESIIIRLMIIVGVLSLIVFFGYFFNPDHIGYVPLFVLLAFVFIYGAWRKLYLWYHYFSIKVPQRPSSEKPWKVDILTTYFPGEPYDMILNTLKAIQNISYPHTTYLCDEGNDAYLIEECKKLGIIHVTRHNRVNAKAGNINNALKQATGEICVILDPDHIPNSNFLDRVLPYFEDDKIGFVQIVQGYYNKYETLVARGAAEQTFQFYGPMMMCMNSYGTVNAIGANCTFRRKALDSIGGHAPGLAEDMHTAMLLHSKSWKSVYVPEFLAKGLVPADITSYYKQQLKWSRGTFELLYTVYPKLFKKFSLRQKIHYALMPFHYFIGFIYLLSFLIPILSLLLAKMPWTGNILEFIAMSTPVFLSGLLIRTYIQKWVIEENERGFHVIGGILQIVSWWIYLLGIIYTLVRKKIPYLPTPKDEQSYVNFTLLVPNLIIAVLSIGAVIYGLNKDLTPFSLVMSFFALLNALFMFFSFYLSSSSTNRNKILRNNLREKTVNQLSQVKRNFRNITNFIFVNIRILALPLLVLGILGSVFMLRSMNRNEWETISSKNTEVKDFRYLGIFQPEEDNGLSSLTTIDSIENTAGLKFNLVSVYSAWNNQNDSLLESTLTEIIDRGYTPLLTWEPWSSLMEQKDSISDLGKENKVLFHTVHGVFDNYIRKTANLLKNTGSSVFLRFAHEFDNPYYPWSNSGKNTNEDFIAAWKHIHHIFREEGAHNVLWVWNPWKSTDAFDYYPGELYVDWLGLNILDYGPYNKGGKHYSFNELYAPFEELQQKIDKPVLLSEFGSVNEKGAQTNWIKKAFKIIDQTDSEIKGLVFFNSKVDNNLPTSYSGLEQRLDWSVNFSKLGSDTLVVESADRSSKASDTKFLKNHNKKVILENGLRGVVYNKADNWRKNRYTPSKDILEKDFGMMKELGVDFISVQPSKIYEHNLMKYAKIAGLKVLYNFQIPNDIDFLADIGAKENFKKLVIETIDEFKGNKTVLGWQLRSGKDWGANGLTGRLSGSFAQRIYIAFISEIANAIKEHDSTRFLGLEIRSEAHFNLNFLQEKLQDRSFNVDAIGLSISSQRDALMHNKLYENDSSSIYISNYSIEEYLAAKKPFSKKVVILDSWQNTYQDMNVGFNGILDFEGRKTQRFYKLMSKWSASEPETPSMPDFKVVRPATPLFAGEIADYHLVFKNGNNYQLPNKDLGLKVEWQLVKKDQFGNHLAIKKIGEGPVSRLTLPRNPNNYEIMATVTDDNISSFFKCELNTPLHY